MRKRLRTRRLFIPFSYKIMIPYLVLVLLTDALIGSISYSMLVKSRTELAESSIRTLVSQIRTNMAYKMDEIQRMSDTLFSSLSFQNAIVLKGNQLETMLNIRDNIIPELKAPLVLYVNHIRLALYVTNDQFLEVTGDSMTAPITKSDYYVLMAGEIENSDWFRRLDADDGGTPWHQIEMDPALGNLSHFRKLVSYNGGSSPIGYLRATVRLDELLGSDENAPFDQGFSIRLVDGNTGETLYEKGTATASPNGSFLSIKEEVSDLGYVIEAQIPHAYLNKGAGRLQRLIGLICLASFAVMASIGLVVARLSGMRMKRIVKQVRSFKDGSLYKRIAISGNDEFVQIAHSFNQMAADIEQLINDVYVQGLQKKQAELDALQAQISPHFLYNTLSAIGSLANLGEAQKVTQMVQALSRFYRLTLSEGHSIITVEQEVEQVAAYLDIQRVKYADAFSVAFDIADEIKPYPVLKLILQPFVENIFKHAWFGETISIRIWGRLTERGIELGIIDNGVGMRPETLHSLQSEAAQAGGYGLKNVEERIKLRYGPDYGIAIRSLYGAGTAVRLLLPAEKP
ncbi:cache domain-containing sensor histidine kinase [Gorillibacterium sp. sgz500922]|uniref:cache domain-containing sensor histidine kinase n=1 Tax=Gorillibacterium sp. sgz500922 TaxID=3446694 RepID=UPI003F6704E0